MNRTTVTGGRVSNNEDGKEERERRVRAFQTGIRAIVSEMKRVTWPSQEEWVSATLVTVGLVVVVALWTTLIGTASEWFFKTVK